MIGFAFVLKSSNYIGENSGIEVAVGEVASALFRNSHGEQRFKSEKFANKQPEVQTFHVVTSNPKMEK
ncbi:hypothetical protein [Paenibacillus riograndensis]|uniref:hypothetical protein n=1 Tax=Paenibacillus riograndensis TaxID=483937 RepID=UPI000A4A4575|nr:hypothetical protein [Paenibacillus riograndensis]